MIKHAKLINGKLEAVADESVGVPVVETPPPDKIEYGTKAVAHYEQQGEQIVNVWELVPWSGQDWENARATESET